MKKITLLLYIIIAFTGLQAQALSGDYYIPQGANPQGFASLYDASVALANNGLSGNTNFIIAANLTETKSTGLVNTSDFLLTIKPGSAAMKTITYQLEQRTATGDITPVKGAIAIGVKPSMLTADYIASKNIVIDGSFDGGINRYFTIITTSNTLVSHNPIIIYNASNKITIKNCSITHPGNKKADGTTEWNQDAYVLLKTYTDGLNAMPFDVTIENNEITAQDYSEQASIRFDATDASGGRAAAPATRSTGVVVKNNVILGRTYGVGISHVNGIVVEGNVLRMNKSYDGTGSSAIGPSTWWNRNNANNAGTITVRNNKILELAKGGSNCNGIATGGGGTWEVYNNFVTGFNYKGAKDGLIILNGINADAGGSKIYNNTIFMNKLPANLPKLQADTTADYTSSYSGITVSTWNNNFDIKNNIIITNEDRVANQLLRTNNKQRTYAGAYTSNYNILYLRVPAGNTNAAITRQYRTLSDYQAGMSGKDVNSKSVDVSFTAETTGDLHIAGSSVTDQNLAVPVLSPAIIDIDGETRQTTTYAGADQSLLPFTTVSVKTTKNDFKIMRTSTGLKVTFEGEKAIELFSVNGSLIEKTSAVNEYSRSLNKGIYILKLNGKSAKIVL